MVRVRIGFYTLSPHPRMVAPKPCYVIRSSALQGVRHADVDRVNNLLSQVLCASKNLIDEYGRNGKWDNAKTFTNPYELVYKTDAISFAPVSRAFFKMWEMMVDYSIGDDGPLNIAYIAEGPGGFIQAAVEYRKTVSGGVGDRHTAITLVSKRRSVPCWKISNDWADRNNVEFFYGEDGSGDIYNIANVKAFCAKCEGCDVVTADGGFDFSGDFNSQERNVLKMLVAEVLCAVLTLRQGGVFVFKAFDTLSRATACIIQILVECFDEVCCVKPLSSRPANAEKYLMCRGYHRPQGLARAVSLERILGTAEVAIDLAITDAVPLDAGVYYNLCLANIAMVARQMLTISKTLAFIKSGKRDYTRQDQESFAEAWTDHYM